MPIGEAIGIWVAAVLTFMIFSFLYKDNPVFKLAEHIFLGFAVAYAWCQYYWMDIFPKALQPLFYPSVDAPFNPWVIIPVVLGLFIILRIVPSLAWLSRISFALYIGGYAGMAIPNVISNLFLPQLTATLAPVGPSWPAAINQLVLLVGVFCTVVFFFFSLEHRGFVGRVGRVGVLFVMLAFGASFGYTVMARVSLLIGRFQFLLEEWVHKALLGGS